MTTGRTNASSGGGASITITLRPAVENITINAVGGGETSTAVTNSSGVATVYVQPNITYTVSATSGSYESKSVSVGKKPIAITLKEPTPYICAEIDTTNSDPLSCVSYPQTVTINGVTYGNDCYGFTKAYGTGANCLGSDWSDHWIVSKIKPVSSDGGTTPVFTDAPKDPADWVTGTEYFTQFDHTWYCIETDGNTIRVIIANTENNPDSTRFVDYAFLGANGSTSRNAFHVGCFQASGSESAIYSKCSNTTLSASNSIYNFKGANARGSEYDCMSHQQLTYIQILFILIYGSLNSQTAHSAGLSSSNNTNSALPCSNDFGMAGGDYTTRMAFFWIHDLWGNMWQYIGGLFVRAGSTRTLYYYLPRMAQSGAWDNNAWAGGTGTSVRAKQTSIGTSTGKTSNMDVKDYIKEVCGNNTGGFAPMSYYYGSSSSTTYFADSGKVNKSSSYAYFVKVGGYPSSGDERGIFCCDITNVSNSTSSTYHTSRLAYRGGATVSAGSNNEN